MNSTTWIAMAKSVVTDHRSDRIAPWPAARKNAPGGLDRMMWQNGVCTNDEKNELPGSHESHSLNADGD
jgi:hypothetical protein